MRKSTYTKILKIDHEKSLLFSGVNGAMDIISSILALQLDSCLEEIERNDIDFLKSRGHITSLDEEEEKKRFLNLVEMLDRNTLQKSKLSGHIMFLLSYDCNLDCSYCYQKPIRNENLGKKLEPKDIDVLMNDLWKPLFDDLSFHQVSYNLYGGEPFLWNNLKTIERILYYSNKYKQHVSSISNGTEIYKMKELFGPHYGQVNFVQISLDGYEKEHNQSRVNLLKDKSFDKIIEAIHLVLERNAKVNVRINIKDDSLESLTLLENYLKEQEILEHPRAHVYVHPIHNHFEQTDGSSLLTMVQTDQKMKRLTNMHSPIDRKVSSFQKGLLQHNFLSMARTRYCMQNSPYNYLVDPFYDIYGCYEEAGRKDRRIGSWKDKKVEWKPLFKEYQKRSLLLLEKCHQCPWALLCGGECSVQSCGKTGSLWIPHCEESQAVFSEVLLRIAQYGLKMNQSSWDDPLELFPNL